MMEQRVRSGGWRERLARVAWYSHPAHPGPQYGFLKESQWWPRERIEQHQAAALRRIVGVAQAVPFHARRFAEAGVSPADITSVADIRRLPILERADLVRLGVEGMKVPGSWGMRASTSGSTGTVVRFLWPLEQMRWLDAGEARARAWMGSDVGTRRVEVRCRPVGLAQAVSATLLNSAAFHAPVVTDVAAVRRLAQALTERPPVLVWGVSNALYVVALALLEDGTPVKAGACWSGGNHLHSHYRRAFEQAFQCEVYERYATMETGLIAHECVEGRSLHVPAEGLIVEILRDDGEPAGAGEEGDVVVTTLHNTATPLLRYRIGDRAIAATNTQCSCGRGLPVFGRVVGRRHDYLRTVSGAHLSPAQVVDAVRPGSDTVTDFQVVQAPDGSLKVSVVQRDGPTVVADRERVAAVFQSLVQSTGRPVVERVSHIRLSPGGKLRTIIAEPRD